MLDLRDLSFEGVERLCQADMTWKLVPLYYCPGKEREACIVFVFSQLAVLMSVSIFSLYNPLFQCLETPEMGPGIFTFLRAYFNFVLKHFETTETILETSPYESNPRFAPNI